MFLALLLSSFGGDAFSNDDEEEGQEKVKKPKETRIKRIMKWMKKKKAKKKATVDVVNGDNNKIMTKYVSFCTRYYILRSFEWGLCFRGVNQFRNLASFA